MFVMQLDYIFRNELLLDAIEGTQPSIYTCAL